MTAIKPSDSTNQPIVLAYTHAERTISAASNAAESSVRGITIYKLGRYLGRMAWRVNPTIQCRAKMKTICSENEPEQDEIFWTNHPLITYSYKRDTFLIEVQMDRHLWATQKKKHESLPVRFKAPIDQKVMIKKSADIAKSKYGHYPKNTT